MYYCENNTCVPDSTNKLANSLKYDSQDCNNECVLTGGCNYNTGKCAKECSESLEECIEFCNNKDILEENWMFTPTDEKVKLTNMGRDKHHMCVINIDGLTTDYPHTVREDKDRKFTYKLNTLCVTNNGSLVVYIENKDPFLEGKIERLNCVYQSFKRTDGSIERNIYVMSSTGTTTSPILRTV